MNDKFNEVSTDILNTILSIKYEDKEKEVIKDIIMYNIYQMTKSEQTFEKGVQALKLANTRTKGNQ